jgi:arsenate reductase
VKLLFLCTGNSCRSQIAEGFSRDQADADLTVLSAGIETHGLNPRAVTVMAESGIDIAHQTSDIFVSDLIGEGDWVISVCDHAKESCPVLPITIRRLHWSFDDPARATGTEDEIMTVFRRVRDEIGAKVEELFAGTALRGQQVTEL